MNDIKITMKTILDIEAQTGENLYVNEGKNDYVDAFDAYSEYNKRVVKPFLDIYEKIDKDKVSDKQKAKYVQLANESTRLTRAVDFERIKYYTHIYELVTAEKIGHDFTIEDINNFSKIYDDAMRDTFEIKSNKNDDDGEKKKQKPFCGTLRMQLMKVFYRGQK